MSWQKPAPPINSAWKALGYMSDRKHTDYTISFIVPALNEEVVLEQTVTQIVECLSARAVNYEIILIDDGSVDGTLDIMNRLAAGQQNIRVLSNERNIGLGASYCRGVAESRNEYVMLLCGDGGLPAASLPPILDAVGTADIVIPYMDNLKEIKSPFRYILSRAYTRLLNLLFGLNLRYYNGLPVHRLALLQQLEIGSEGFGFQGEVLVKLLKTGHSFVQVGVQGAEESRRSSALRLANIVSVVTTLVKLVCEVRRYVRSEHIRQKIVP